MVVALALMLLVGCADDRAAQAALDPPWPQNGAPAALQALSTDLAGYQQATGHLPESLAVLDSSGFATKGPYGTSGYAYHQAGIGVLREGWRIVVADDHLSEGDQMWCVVRPPVRVSGMPPMNVVRVPLGEMRQAAAAAGGRGR